MRRYSLFGDALAHSAFGGVAFGLFIGIYPLWIACIVAILSALGLTKIRQKFDISSDAIVAILFATGLGAGVILLSMADDLDAVERLANKVACLNKTLFFHGISEDFFSDDEVLKKYSETSMQMHMHHH